MPYYGCGGGASGHVHPNLSVLNQITAAGNGRIGSFDPPAGTDDWDGSTPSNIHEAVARLAAAFRKHAGTRVPVLE
jgi:hypothetical protein